MATDIGAISAKITANISDYREGIEKAKALTDDLKGATKDTTTEMTKTEKVMSNVGKEAKSLGVAYTALSVAMTAVIKKAVDVSASFEQSMANVKAISGATAEEFEALRNKAAELGASTIFTASQAADGMGYLAMAGFKTNEILSAMPGVLALAAAGNMDLARTADIASNILTGFQLTADETGRVVDVLAKAMTSSNTNVEQLGYAMKYVAPVAASVGLSIEETAAAIGKLSDAGIQGEMAGTQLRAILLRLINPSAESAKLMEELGINIQDANGRMLPFAQIIGNVEQAFAGLTEAQKAEYAATLAGMEATSGFLTLINTGSETLNAFTDELRNAGGTAERIAETQMDTLNGAITQMKSALEAVGISVGDKFAPAIRTVAELITKALLGFEKLNPSMQTAIIAFTTITPLVAGAVTAFYALRAALIAVQASVPVIGLLSLAVGGLVAVLSGFSSANNESADATRRNIEAQQEQISQLDSLIAKFDELKDKPNKTAEEFEELKSVQNQIAQINPQLVNSYDELGNAMIDTSEKAKELSESMKNQLRLEAQAAYYDALKNIDKAQEKLNKLNDELANKQEHLKANEEGILHLKEEIIRIENDESIPNKEEMIRLIQAEIKGLETTNAKIANGALELAKSVSTQHEYVENLKHSIKYWRDITDESKRAREIMQSVVDFENQVIAYYDNRGKAESPKAPAPKTATSTPKTIRSGTRPKTAEELANERYRLEMKNLDYKRNLDQLTEQEELQHLERLLDQYGKYADIRMDIEVRIHRIQKQLAAEAERASTDQARAEEDRVRSAFEFSRQWIADEEFRMKKAGESEEAIAQMKIDAWSRVRARYAENTEFYKRADRELYAAQSELLRQVEREQAEVMRNLEESRRDVERSIRGIYEELARRIRDEERRELDSIERRKKADIAALDARKKAIEEFYDSQLRDVDEEERTEERKKLADELEKYKDATSAEGIKRRQELEEQLRRLDRENQRRHLQEQKDAELRNLDERKEAINNYYENLKNRTQESYMEMAEAVRKYSENMASVEELLQDNRLSAFLETNEDIIADLESFVEEYNRIVERMNVPQGMRRDADTGGGGRVGGGSGSWVAPSHQFDSVEEQMRYNSESWWYADEMSRKKLEEENERLGRQHGFTKKDGRWYDKDGNPIYHTGGIVGIRNFTRGDTLMPDEIRAVLQRSELVFQPEQLNALVSAVAGAERPAGTQPPPIVHVEFTGDIHIAGDDDIERVGRGLATVIDRQFRFTGRRSE